jgi:hypothetical protein
MEERTGREAARGWVISEAAVRDEHERSWVNWMGLATALSAGMKALLPRIHRLILAGSAIGLSERRDAGILATIEGG